ncbi:hypothetical protein N474_22810 [Pseudoalteromonas luteoviolacea CPMOR-2]|uniref:Membrane fusion protein (MFP) family protein n=1 Tax=Pseudoalteromonas luteoviolacea DSM 6061 TaxID=1365250 RepID=A0A166YQ55_9GAMM|nr:HlyD family type I secretion periplasmic adaptor subunit [Pseudoalteromonas luteoviolacea]KZN43254.1 hypothetical protein N475_09125 [Pseudoalteromonas luteoviolacea DSM 6061]KZN52669.1 hypothetical protein N474_22810 [Pseudoalteromonas luteoviolacea CPMOR-2]MBE0385479.1 RTX toxin transporter [Pseudoalteromonas luteoviolacea DSM 6061]
MNFLKKVLEAINKNNKSTAVTKRNKNEYEFLPAYLEIIEKPASPWARRIAYLLTGFVVIALVWSIVGKLDIHANALGKVMVSSHSKVIQPLEQGEVLSINVRDGQAVKKGDVLIQLNPIGADAESKRLAEQLVYYKLESERLRALLSDDPINSFEPPKEASALQVETSFGHLSSEHKEMNAVLDRFSAEVQVNEAQLEANIQDLAALKRLKKNIEARLDARKNLESSQAIARVEILEQEKELLEAERTMVSLNAQSEVLKAEALSLAEQRDSYLAQKRREFHEELNQSEIITTQTEQDLIKAREKQRLQSLRSPVDGVVQQLSIHTLGGVVTPAQALMVVVPKVHQLEAEVNVLNKDVGFVVAGQTVEIKIDSFPFTKYGTISGKVLHVSRDAVKDEQLGYVFPARIQLDDERILVDESWVPVTAGMSVTAEIKTGSRRVIEYLLSPLQKYQSEALRER